MTSLRVSQFSINLVVVTIILSVLLAPQARGDGGTATTAAETAEVLYRGGPGTGVPVQKELCPQRHCSQEHPAH